MADSLIGPEVPNRGAKVRRGPPSLKAEKEEGFSFLRDPCHKIRLTQKKKKKESRRRTEKQAGRAFQRTSLSNVFNKVKVKVMKTSMNMYVMHKSAAVMPSFNVIV